MAFKDMLESLNNDNNSISDEQILEWLNMSPADKAVVIKEAKENGNSEYVLALNETANYWKDVIAWCTASDELREQALEASKEDKELHEYLTIINESSKEDVGKALKSWDDASDSMQKRYGKIADKDIPVVSKIARKAKSNWSDVEAGIKAGRVSNYLGASPETSRKVMKAGIKTSKTVGDAGDAVKKLAGEHGGKMAAAAAAGLGALGLVKALRRKKAKEAS